MKKLFSFLALMVLSVSCVFLTACNDDVKDGRYVQNGVEYQVENHTVKVVGVEDVNSTYDNLVIEPEFKGLSVSRIESEAFKNVKANKISFKTENYSNIFSIGKGAFDGSQIESIENLPANLIFGDETFMGLNNLQSISVFGTGALSVENGVLVETENNLKTLILAPAASIPQANFEDGTLTLTGYNKINDYAFAGNKFITDVVIVDDITRVESYVFKDVNLQRVTLNGDNAKDVFLDGLAFDANKNLKVFVPATTDYEIRSWLSYSKNFIYSHNLLVHPVGCSNSQNHVHGIRSRAGATGSYEGYTYSINETIISIDGDNGWLVTDNCPIYFR